jgi:hypothetical protein
MTLKLKNSDVFKQLKRQLGITVLAATASCFAVLLATQVKRRNWIRSKASPYGICGGHSGMG